METNSPTVVQASPETLLQKSTVRSTTGNNTPMSNPLSTFSGSTLYLDTMVFYLFLRDPESAAQALFAQVASGRIEAYTSVLTFDELTYRMLSSATLFERRLATLNDPRMTLLKKPGTYRQDAKSAKKIKVWLNISCKMARMGTDFHALVQESWRSWRLCGQDSLFAVESCI